MVDLSIGASGVDANLTFSFDISEMLTYVNSCKK
jgi:hypothetical protein